MKYVKYIIFISAAFLAAACQKHELLYEGMNSTEDEALFNITYVEPVPVSNANGLDSLFVNGKRYSDANGAGKWQVNRTLPNAQNNWSTTRYFSAPAGTSSLRIYRADNVVYDRQVTLNAGVQNVFIYSLEADPVVLDDLYPYTINGRRASLATFDTDSIALVRFYNFVYDTPGVPHAGRLQYQWRNSDDKDAAGEYNWHNLGTPVAFGEATERGQVIVHKTIYNSRGYQTINFRCVDESGEEVDNSADYWTVYIGAVLNHIFRGNLNAGAGEQAAAYTQYHSINVSANE